MLYRYRLYSEDKFKRRCLEKIILKKQDWTYSPSPILQSWIGILVEEQVAPVMLDFSAMDIEYERQLKTLGLLSKIELVDIVLSLGFADKDLVGKRKDDLIRMIRDY